MSSEMRSRILKALMMAIMVFVLWQVATPQEKKSKKEQPSGVPVLWKEPKDIASRNLFLGPGGEALKPDLSSVTVVEEKESGQRSLKFRVRDGSGREWQIKIGEEARAETSASRIAWAAGYLTDVTYLAPSVEIKDKGRFENVRFEARMKGMKRLNEWAWDENPFNGTVELQGLKVLLALLDNWNLKNENNKIIYLAGEEGGPGELAHIISDFDVRLDRTLTAPSFWYGPTKQARFLERVKDGIVDFNCSGPHKDRLSGITLVQAKWIAGWLSRLSDQQLNDALRAGNFSPSESQVIQKTLRARINELSALK